MHIQRPDSYIKVEISYQIFSGYGPLYKIVLICKFLEQSGSFDVGFDASPVNIGQVPADVL